LDADLSYRRDSNLKLAESDAEAETLAAFVREQNANGLPDVRMVDRAEALEIVPGLNDRVIAGSYSSEDGHAHPPSVTKAVAHAAERHGATYRNGVQVTALLLDGDRVIGVRTATGEEIQAEETVLAAGAWSDEIAASIGLRLPIQTRALQMLLSTPGAAVLKPVIGSVGRALSLKQLPGGEFFLRPESERGNWAAATGLLPIVGQQQVARKWCGLEARAIDDIPFIGRVPGIDGLTLAVGFSGHGFAISPAVGRTVADLLAGKPTPELDGLAPARISNWSAEEIDRFVNEPAASTPVLAG
jgi:sarcosine oxidase subunit beta